MYLRNVPSSTVILKYEWILVTIEKIKPSFLPFLVPPKIMPFQFTNHLLREGMRASVSCTVLEGDHPIDFIWEFEGKPISIATTQVCLNSFNFTEISSAKF